MYILLAEKENVVTFDELFDLVSTISWKSYFKKDFPIMVKSNSTRSELFAERTIQSLTKKAIVKSRV
jgi:23S rRNA G2445 N2-methylase RlmL